MAILYKNFDSVPGIPLSLEFTLMDDTFLKIDPTGFSFKLEVLNTDLSLRYVSTTDFVTSLGAVKRLLTEDETMGIGSGLFQYRLVMKDATTLNVLVFKGFLNCSEPEFIEGADPSSNMVVLPDGSIYIAKPTTLTPGFWYAISSYYRLVVSGVGTLALDLKNNVGAVVIADQRFGNPTDEDAEWVPYFGQNTSFRITVLAGNPVVKYLP